ncbi:MAG: hypothetical protein HQ521_08665 [Bacteroidetes bacterium]|nr:hypothetical protein [Bacteroidota bacterium]
MEYENLGTPLRETLDEFKAYIESLITYNKLVFVRGAGVLSSYLMLLLLLLGLSGFVLLFLSFAFAGWFVEITGLGIGTGYMVMAVFYIFLGVLVYIYRKRLIFNPTRRLFGNIVFGDFESSIDSTAFDSEEMHTQNIKEVHEKLTKQKDVLNDKLKELEQNLTFANIAQQIIGKAYSSIVSTSNIAKFAFTLIKKFKWFTERKKRKSVKQKEDKELKEGKNKD